MFAWRQRRIGGRIASLCFRFLDVLESMSVDVVGGSSLFVCAQLFGWKTRAFSDSLPYGYLHGCVRYDNRIYLLFTSAAGLFGGLLPHAPRCRYCTTYDGCRAHARARTRGTAGCSRHAQASRAAARALPLLHRWLHMVCGSRTYVNMKRAVHRSSLAWRHSIVAQIRTGSFVKRW